MGNISISFGSLCYNWNSNLSLFIGGLDLCYQLREYSSLFGSINNLMAFQALQIYIIKDLLTKVTQFEARVFYFS
jgi:hypothetical protein